MLGKASEPCKRCNFDDEFIIDYDEEGKEYTFCGNCGTIKKEAESNGTSQTP